MRKFGLKLYSTNLYNAPSIIKESAEFVSCHEDTFIELMAAWGMPEEDFLKIKQQLGNVEVRIHANHEGTDTGNREMEQHNREVFSLAQRVADIFDAKTIVVHGGLGHGEKYVVETARQFKLFNDKRIVMENLPFYDNNGDHLHGSNADEIAYVMNESGCGFCLDFSHAVCAALNTKVDIDAHLERFVRLKPTVYHMCDGDTRQEQDLHLHFGDGNFPLKHFLNDYTAKDAYITMETGLGIAKHNNLRELDYKYIKSLEEI